MPDRSKAKHRRQRDALARLSLDLGSHFQGVLSEPPPEELTEAGKALARGLEQAMRAPAAGGRPAAEQEHLAPPPVSASSIVEEGIVASVEEKIRERAYRLWIEEGQPDGRADHHWEAAARLVEEETTRRPPGETAPAEPQAYGPAAIAATRGPVGRKPGSTEPGS